MAHMIGLNRDNGIVRERFKRAGLTILLSLKSTVVEVWLSNEGQVKKVLPVVAMHVVPQKHNLSMSMSS